MYKVRIAISLTLNGPLLTRATEPGALGLDMAVARNGKGDAYLPGSLIAGALRQAWEELDSVAGNSATWFDPKLDCWLGRVPRHDTPLSKQLLFTDFFLQQTEAAKTRQAVRNRIRIDPERRAVEPHHLVMVEAPFVSGECYLFMGELHFFCQDKEEGENIFRHVQVGIQWVAQIGGLRSVGFGRVVSAECSPPQYFPIPAPVPAPEPLEIIPLRVKPLQPFCIAGRTLAENIFVSKAIIPGGAILGSLATTWNHLTGQQGKTVAELDDPDRKELQANFSKLRITHAFPGSEGKRPVVAPLSLVRIKDSEKYFDVALLDRPCLINGKPPDFAVDWKDDDQTLRGYPWPYIRLSTWGWKEMQTELRIRTAIDRSSLRSAEERLFAYEMIVPGEWSWYAYLDLSRIDSRLRGQVLGQLRSLVAQGVIGLGKTKALAELLLDGQVEPAVPSLHDRPVQDTRWIVTLQTDTLLGAPEEIRQATAAEDLHRMYARAWHELSGGVLNLVRYFARQKLSGGRYRRLVFQANREYRPWLLTEAGSVFVLEVADGYTVADGVACMNSWLQHGLPIGESASRYYGLDANPDHQWQGTPFIPQNGYGEIAVNLLGPNVRRLPHEGVRIDRIQTS